MGPASAYAAVLKSIEEDVQALMDSNPEMFSFSELHAGLVNIRDFQTTGVVSFAKGTPFYELPSGRLDIGGHRVEVKEEYRQLCIASIDELVAKL